MAIDSTSTSKTGTLTSKRLLLCFFSEPKIRGKISVRQVYAESTQQISESASARLRLKLMENDDAPANMEPFIFLKSDAFSINVKLQGLLTPLFLWLLWIHSLLRSRGFGCSDGIHCRNVLRIRPVEVEATFRLRYIWKHTL